MMSVNNVQNSGAEGIINPPVDELLTKVDSKYRLVLFAAKRARQITSYYGNQGADLVHNVGPLVPTNHREKPLTIALHEIESDVLEYQDIDPNAVPESTDFSEVLGEAYPSFDDPFGEPDPA